MSGPSWNDRYAGEEYAYGTEPNDFLRAKSDLIPAWGEVLCLADGEGRNGVYLAGLGYRVTSVDSSSTGMEKAQKLAASRGVELTTVVADLNDYDLGKQRWAGIVSIFCHLPPELRKKVHAGVVRGLKPEGVFLLEAYDPEQLRFKTGGPPVAELMMTKDQVIEEIAGLNILHAATVERSIHEGHLHNGRSMTTEILAKKA